MDERLPRAAVASKGTRSALAELEPAELVRRLERAIELARSLLDHNESLRRLLCRIRATWLPSDPDDLPLKHDPLPFFATARHALIADPRWMLERDAEIERWLQRRTG